MLGIELLWHTKRVYFSFSSELVLINILRVEIF